MSVSTLTKTNNNSVRFVLPVLQSLPYFFIPGLLLFIGFNLGLPLLLRAGLSPFAAYFWPVFAVLTFMLIAALVAYRLEGNPWLKSAFVERFRLQRLSGKDWLWFFGTLAAAFIGMGLFSSLNTLLIESGLLTVPHWVPDFLHPIKSMTTSQLEAVTLYETAFHGLRGNWVGLGMYYLLIFVNIIGEEFWWRGYLLPRQEGASGKWTWVFHGLLWWLFHSFKWWGLLPILPATLIISWIVQKTGKTRLGIYLHLVINGLGLIPLTLITAGLV